ncbi:MULTISPECIES: hypothetical protein [unclassified Glutamicibacter]|uniref:hypothetical protein n=1 Tax=unclassified Glutamicibacter TaxID=2627139 RepID=UPI003817EF6B
MMTYAKDQRIWRYMDLAKYLDLLRTESLYLSPISSFEDRWEGATGVYDLQRDVSRFKGVFENGTPDMDRRMAEGLEEAAAADRDRVFVNCWHANDFESSAMWKLYGITGNSIAIESTIEELAAVGSDEPEKQDLSTVMAVSYHDLLRTPLPHEDAFNLHARYSYKRTSFDHEKEIRLIHYQLERAKDRPIRGLRFGADLSQLIERVVVSPDAAPWFKDVVSDVTAKYGFDFQVQESELNVKPTYGTGHYEFGAAPKWGAEGRSGKPVT